MSKVDLITLAQLQELQSIIKHLNPEAKIIASSFGKVPLTELLNTGSFDFESKNFQSPFYPVF